LSGAKRGKIPLRQASPAGTEFDAGMPPGLDICAGGDAWRSGILPRFAPLKLDAESARSFAPLDRRPSAQWDPGRAVRRHHHRDVSACRALSALYYADRLNSCRSG